MTLHIYSHGKHVAMIGHQPRAADTYRAEEPWLLLHNTGRVDRFATQRDARFEAVKTWPDVRITRDGGGQRQPRQAVRAADGTLENFTLKVAGKPFRCACKCNVFHKPDNQDLNLYACNACGQEFESE